MARQHERGERIALPADPGSFREMSGLAGSATYRGEELMAFTPKPAVHGMCTLERRKLVVTGGDFTSVPSTGERG